MTTSVLVPKAEPLVRVCRITAYCDRGTTASGVAAGPCLCAAPYDIPFGTIVSIPELGIVSMVADRTSRRYRQSTVDLWLPTKSECLKFGVKYLEVHFYTEPP